MSSQRESVNLKNEKLSVNKEASPGKREIDRSETSKQEWTKKCKALEANIKLSASEHVRDLGNAQFNILKNIAEYYEK